MDLWSEWHARGRGFDSLRLHFSWNNSFSFRDRTFAGRTDGVGANPAPRKTRHVYFGLEVIQEYECGGAASVGSCTSAPLLVRDFVHGDPQRYPEVVAMQTYTINFPNPEDPPVSVPSAAYHYLHDVLGSVIGLVNDAGELVEQYTYDPYGKVFIEKWDAAANGGAGAWLASAEPTSGKLPVSSIGNPFLWTGHRYDAAVGLYATLYRTYSPTLGRWLQRDPAEYIDGVNLYEAMRSNPVVFTDPFGDAVPLVAGAVVGLSTAETIAASFGLTLTACMATPSCRDAVYEGLRDGVRETANVISRAAERIADRAWRLRRAIERRFRDGYRRRGDCTPGQHDALQAAVEMACKEKAGERSCVGVSDCKTILANLAKNAACNAARNRINMLCFGGGNLGHQTAANQSATAMGTCVSQGIANHCFKRHERPGHGCNK